MFNVWKMDFSLINWMFHLATFPAAALTIFLKSCERRRKTLPSVFESLVHNGFHVLGLSIDLFQENLTFCLRFRTVVDDSMVSGADFLDTSTKLFSGEEENEDRLAARTSIVLNGIFRKMTRISHRRSQFVLRCPSFGGRLFHDTFATLSSRRRALCPG